jgi:hypothetical protein
MPDDKEPPEQPYTKQRHERRPAGEVIGQGVLAGQLRVKSQGPPIVARPLAGRVNRPGHDLPTGQETRTQGETPNWAGWGRLLMPLVYFARA